MDTSFGKGTVWLGAGLWMMGCQAVPTASSTPGPETRPTSTPSAVEPAGTTGAPKPGEAGPGGSPFVEVTGGPCADRPEVIDAEDATFLVSTTQARRAQPGRAELEEVAGLPSPRGETQGFAMHPFILAVKSAQGTPPGVLDVLGYFLLDARQHTLSPIETARFGKQTAFGDSPIALPVRDGTLVITYTRGTKRPSDPGYGVPGGDGSEALMASKDGIVRPFPSWPNVLFRNPVLTADEVVWAMTIRPGMPGHFVLRVPLHVGGHPATGVPATVVAVTPQYFPVPGTQGCRGDERFSYPATLVEEGASADEVTVVVRATSSCLAKGAGGRYRLHTPDARWSKRPASSAEEQGAPKPRPVQIGGATLRIEGTRALYTGPGAQGERDADPDPPGDPAQERSLVVTAGGREVWLETRWKTRCQLGRYRSW